MKEKRKEAILLSRNSSKIMVIDDEERLLLAIKRYLVTQGFQVIVCESGKTALDRLNNENIDLIVTSSAKRTLKTAKIIAENFDIDKNKIQSINEIYEANADAYIHVLRSLNDEKVKTVIIVGHNPTIAAMVAMMSGNEIIEFKPSAFAVFNISIETWKIFRIIKAENILSHTP